MLGTVIMPDPRGYDHYSNDQVNKTRFGGFDTSTARLGANSNLSLNNNSEHRQDRGISYTSHIDLAPSDGDTRSREIMSSVSPLSYATNTSKGEGLSSSASSSPDNGTFYERLVGHSRMAAAHERNSLSHTDRPLQRGVCKWFDGNKGYGFITPDNGGPEARDVFVHQSQIVADGFRRLAQGQPVVYILDIQQDNHIALNVTGPEGRKIEPIWEGTPQRVAERRTNRSSRQVQPNIQQYRQPYIQQQALQQQSVNLQDQAMSINQNMWQPYRTPVSSDQQSNMDRNALSGQASSMYAGSRQFASMNSDAAAPHEQMMHALAKAPANYPNSAPTSPPNGEMDHVPGAGEVHVPGGVGVNQSGGSLVGNGSGTGSNYDSSHPNSSPSMSNSSFSPTRGVQSMYYRTGSPGGGVVTVTASPAQSLGGLRPPHRNIPQANLPANVQYPGSNNQWRSDTKATLSRNGLHTSKTNQSNNGTGAGTQRTYAPDNFNPHANTNNNGNGNFLGPPPNNAGDPRSVGSSHSDRSRSNSMQFTTDSPRMRWSMPSSAPSNAEQLLAGGGGGGSRSQSMRGNMNSDWADESSAAFSDVPTSNSGLWNEASGNDFNQNAQDIGQQKDHTPYDGHNARRSELPTSTGICKWFDPTKGFGFITPAQGGRDVFVHQSQLHCEGFRRISEGQRLEFYLVEQDGKHVAHFVTGPGGRLLSPSIKGEPSLSDGHVYRQHNGYSNIAGTEGGMPPGHQRGGSGGGDRQFYNAPNVPIAPHMRGAGNESRNNGHAVPNMSNTGHGFSYPHTSNRQHQQQPQQHNSITHNTYPSPTREQQTIGGRRERESQHTHPTGYSGQQITGQFSQQTVVQPLSKQHSLHQHHQQQQVVETDTQDLISSSFGTGGKMPSPPLRHALLAPIGPRPGHNYRSNGPDRGLQQTLGLLPLKAWAGQEALGTENEISFSFARAASAPPGAPSATPEVGTNTTLNNSSGIDSNTNSNNDSEPVVSSNLGRDLMLSQAAVNLHGYVDDGSTMNIGFDMSRAVKTVVDKSPVNSLHRLGTDPLSNDFGVFGMSRHFDGLDITGRMMATNKKNRGPALEMSPQFQDTNMDNSRVIDAKVVAPAVIASYPLNVSGLSAGLGLAGSGHDEVDWISRSSTYAISNASSLETIGRSATDIKSSYMRMQAQFRGGGINSVDSNLSKQGHNDIIQNAAPVTISAPNSLSKTQGWFGERSNSPGHHLNDAFAFRSPDVLQESYATSPVQMALPRQASGDAGLHKSQIVSSSGGASSPALSPTAVSVPLIAAGPGAVTIQDSSLSRAGGSASQWDAQVNSGIASKVPTSSTSVNSAGSLAE